jgi:hypothetical protein
MAEQYPADVIARAAKRLFAIAEAEVPGVYDLEFFRERVATNPDFVTDEDQLRCEFYAEAGCHYNENGEPTCNEPVTTAVFMNLANDDTADKWQDWLYSCGTHAPEFAEEDGFIRMEPLRPLSQEVR